MIAEEVKISKIEYHKVYAMEKWCYQCFGQSACELDQVDSTKTWCLRYKFGDTIWYFAQAKDALMFRLVWT
jgi:hypothetical protein